MSEFIQSIDPIYSRIALFILFSIFLFTTSKKILNRFYPLLQEEDKWYSIKKFVMNTIYVIVFLVFNDNWIEFSLRYVVDIKERRLIKTR